MITKEATDSFLRLGTPFYYYDTELLESTLEEYSSLLSEYGWKAHYAVKANCDNPILRKISDAGLGADCVSGGEIEAAIENGFRPEDIVFAGVGKTDFEIKKALEAGIGCFNCESIEELTVINAIAAAEGKSARYALRINPGIDAHTLDYISTGRSKDKFGFTEKMVKEFFDIRPTLAHCEFIGLHFHIGSQITDLKVFQILCQKASQSVRRFDQAGLKVRHLNLGGGLGIDYQNPDKNPKADFKTYFETLKDGLDIPEGVQVHLEPGRSIVAQSGYLVSRVLYVKDNGEKVFAILDAGMNNLIRPALYKARHKIINLTSANANRTYDVVGPICESSDCFAEDVTLPECRRGDLLAICSTGAYGEVMEMKYNRRNFARTHYGDEIMKYNN